MNRHIKLAAAFVLFLAIAALSNITPAAARGGGVSHLTSPGYQRALEESRRRYRESYSQPYAQPRVVHPRTKKWRHRGRH